MVLICNESVGKPKIYDFRVRKLLILLDARLRETIFLDFFDRFNGIVEFQNIETVIIRLRFSEPSNVNNNSP